MAALVGCVLSYALLVSGVSGADSPTQGEICASETHACTLALATRPAALNAAGAAIDYATPAEVNCPSVARDSAPLFGGCDLPVFDFRYRVSRFPDSERPTGALGPQRERRATNATTISSSTPGPHPASLVTIAAAPMAIYAVGRLSPPREGALYQQTDSQAATRVLEPLERPPRA